MNTAAELHLAAMRRRLANAHDLETRGLIGLADAHGRAAARELEKALAEQERDDHLPLAAA